MLLKQLQCDLHRSMNPSAQAVSRGTYLRDRSPHYMDELVPVQVSSTLHGIV